ncbi:mis18-binding protein 1 isoform X1 [Monodelphis domestica]|uniref:MIS18 binding protein 1 n=2 Tax=Monodelphis domestica TaxID=13616 RepID=F7ADT3_MONDO|nr:mis18-binding protein 1 isoform X1 [Monodelphis domestica]XP_007476622.1 mis18-binding protein 1 isoform X1 [Monodelphis domestica]XP_007476623.1 mis18-binding protein 1 isoform X1 [Monodelphis domestica]XP_007476624.1 mis18-binding protein 1 isoform X1 [Monodelphis domestica]
MITACPKSQETPKFSLNSFRRGNVPINAVLSNNIPSETLTPLKDLVKYKNNNLNDNNNTNDLGEHVNPEVEHYKSEISTLQSTVIAGHLNSNSFSHDFGEKANEHKGTTFSNEEVFKRNETFDILTCESPAKLFQRMKTRSLLATQKHSLPDSSLLELQRTQRDVILSPLLSERSKLNKTFISGFPDCHKVSSDERSFSGGELPNASGGKASSHTKETSLKNFQNSLFLPVKQKITHQQEKQFCHHNLTYDITSSKEKQENISTSLILSEALTMSKSARLLQEDENRVTSIEFSQCDTLILENIDADDERSQSPNVISTNCEHVNIGNQLSKCDNEVPKEGLLEPETSKESERKIPETVQQGTTSDICKILITPKYNTIASEKKVSKVSTNLSHANKNTLVPKKKEICLQNWMIRNMNNNTAVCVEGKLMDTPDLYWHSNAIVERLDYNKLKTLTGNIYILKGTIDTVSMKEAGFPANFTRKFIFGFPKNWKQYVDDLLQELRTFSKKEKKSKIDKETDKYVFEMRMKKGDTSEETESETLSRSVRNKNSTYDVSENCSEELPTGCVTLPRSSELNLCPINKPYKVPLKLRYGEYNNCDNQINITFQTEGKNCLHKEESAAKSESKQMTSPKKIRNHEAKTNEAIFKSLKRVRNNAVKDTTQELIESSDTQSSREEFLSDTEKMECINNIEKKLAVVLTPMNSRKTLEQKCKEHNLSISTIKRISELALPKHKVENAGYKALLRKNKNNRLLRSLEVTFGSGLISKSEDDEDTGICTSSTFSQKIKMPSPPKEQSPTSDSEKKIRKSLRLKRIDPSVNMPSHKIQTKVSEISSQESETEEDSRKKVHFGMKTRQKTSKETLADQSKCKRKDTRKSPVILEHESEESDKDFHSKTKKTTSSPNKTVQKTGNRRKVSSAQLRSRKTKEQPLESFPGLTRDDNWTEKELQKLQGVLSTVPKQKHGYWLNGASFGSSQTAEEYQKKHTEEHQGKGSRKRAIKKMVPSPKVSNGTGAETDSSQPLKITARVGTLKRKQQMRDFLEQLPKDDHDDMFSGSPLHSQRIQLPNFDVSQDDDFLHMDRDPTTPSSVIYPLAKTPQCQHVSPGMLESVNRKDFDKYVFHMQRESKNHGGIVWGNVKKKLVGTDFTTPVSRRTTHFKKGIKSDIGKLFTQSTKLNFDEEDQDDYFSNSDSAE